MAIVLVNGAFGVGKTTVARSLAARIPGSVIHDPELVGIALQRAARLLGRTVEDFQDLPLWRTLTVAALRVARLRAPAVIVPMAFSEPAYLDEIRRGVAAFEPTVHHYCLVASVAVVHARLAARGADAVAHEWQYRRAAECCVAHASDAFRVHVDAGTETPDEIADRLLADMERASS
jgi:hypothetical protein